MKIVWCLGIAIVGLTATTEASRSGEGSLVWLPLAYSPSYSWAGLYVGAQIGRGWGQTQYSQFPHASPAGLVSPMDLSGATGGAYVGYSFQFGSLVAGIEADAAKSWIRSQSVWVAADQMVRTEFDWSASIRGRLGYAIGRVMLYITAGVTIARINFPYTRISDPGGDNEQTRTGWTAGAGLEFALADNLIFRGEYRYTDFGENFYVKPIEDGGVHPSDTPVTVQEVRAGIAYRFVGASLPPVDKSFSYSNTQPIAWRGLYAGAQGSHAWGRSTYTGLANLFAKTELDPSGNVPWLYGGYNFQFGQTVLGVEGDVMLSAIHGGGHAVTFAGQVVPHFYTRSELEKAWSVRGRLGFVFGNVLPYVTAGIAVANYNHTIELGTQHRTFYERLATWTAGAGLDYALSEHLILRGEYRYTPHGQAGHYSGVANLINLTIQEVRAGIAFKL
jgi:outer membrane immunogenic protein